MKSKFLSTYSLRAKFKAEKGGLFVELVIMNHDNNEITEFRIPLSYDEKVEKVHLEKNEETSEVKKEKKEENKESSSEVTSDD